MLRFYLLLFFSLSLLSPSTSDAIIAGIQRSEKKLHPVSIISIHTLPDNDDVEEVSGGITCDSADLDFGDGDVAFHFRNIAVPQASKIHTAFLTIYGVRDGYSGDAKVVSIAVF